MNRVVLPAPFGPTTTQTPEGIQQVRRRRGSSAFRASSLKTDWDSAASCSFLTTAVGAAVGRNRGIGLDPGCKSRPQLGKKPREPLSKYYCKERSDSQRGLRRSDRNRVPALDQSEPKSFAPGRSTADYECWIVDLRFTTFWCYSISSEQMREAVLN